MLELHVFMVNPDCLDKIDADLLMANAVALELTCKSLVLAWLVPKSGLRDLSHTHNPSASSLSKLDSFVC